MDASAGKRKSMSSAFAKILSKKSKGDIPILSERKTGGSSGLSAEQRKEKELRKKILQNRRQKLDIRERGHVKEVQYGADPEQDKLEKHLVRTATKGVVKLFNAIYQAQKQHQKAGRDRDMARQAKSNLLDQLQGAARNVSEIEVSPSKQKVYHVQSSNPVYHFSLSLSLSVDNVYLILLLKLTPSLSLFFLELATCNLIRAEWLVRRPRQMAVAMTKGKVAEVVRGGTC